jgi:hypothetical protein
MGQEGLGTMQVVNVPVPVMCSTVQGSRLATSPVDDPQPFVSDLALFRAERASQPSCLAI